MDPVARNIPCDIDEMIDVVTADDGFHAPFDNGNFGFGKFETGGRRSGDSVIRLANSSEYFRSASRRSSDPGVIDFSTVALPSSLPSYNAESLSAVRPPLPISTDEHPGDGRFNKSETMLRCYEAMQRLKRRKLEQARSCVTSLEISVKVDSSSSRSSIFATRISKVNSHSSPIVLDAILPIEVENGQRVSKTRAKIEAERLGSYDIRHGQPPLSSGKNLCRIPAGRTRLVWTRKGFLDQRDAYTSLITGRRLENGAVKRPRNIQVCVRVNGEIFHGPKTTDHETAAIMKSQASLHCDRLLRNILDGRSDKTNLPFFIPPSIECIPDNTGSIHVVCTSPGSILQSSIKPILELAGKNSKRRCTVCWRSTDGGCEVKECAKCGLLAHIECCLDAGELRVVPLARDQGRKEEWMCNVCCYHSENDSHVNEAEGVPQQVQSIKKSRRISRPPSKLTDANFDSMKSENVDYSTVAAEKEMKCSICRLSGGAMSCIFAEGDEHWVHETCRIWTGLQRYSSGSGNPQCILCSATGESEKPSKKKISSQCVVKCAAPGCHLSVHPMCALASTLASKFRNKEISDEKSDYVTCNDMQTGKSMDEELCSQYTLTFASVRGLAHSFGKDPGARCATTLPIIFCGIHNPARDESFGGLYPGGKFIDKEQTLTVPSC